jgi:hypothetical protein
MQGVWFTGQPDQQRRITFKLSSGRLVWVVAFRYSGTYDSLLEGRPNPELNKRIIDERLKASRLRAWDKLLLLTPETRTDDRGGVHLPPICCSAELMSSPMNQEMHGSSLTVVWFAPPFFAEPLTSFVEKSLKEVPWEQNARDFEF